MKVKRFTKLALAGVGLAATAATLTTATYAWYVTNSEVTATGVQGEVASSANGSLYIAKNKVDTADEPDKYKTSIELVGATKQNGAYTQLDTDLAEGKYRFDSLLPQTKYRGDTDYIGKANLLEGAQAADLASKDAKLAYMQTKYNGSLTSNAYFTTFEGEGDEDNVYAKYNEFADTLTLQNPIYSQGNADVFIAKKFVTITEIKAKLATAENGLTPEQTTALNTAITKTAFNASLVSTYYKDKNKSAFATNLFDESASYYDATNVITKGDWIDATGERATETFVEFKFWLRSDEGGNATIKLKIDNTSSQVNSQILQTTTGKPTNVSNVGDAFTADAIYALRMNVEQQNGLDRYVVETVADAAAFATKKSTLYTEDGGVYTKLATDATYDGDETYYIAKYTDLGDFELDKIAKDKTGLAAYASSGSTAAENGVPFTNLSGGDANKYYYELMGDVAASNTANADGTSNVDTGEDSWASVNLTAGVDTLFTFRIWLEGSDAECWDSCKGQSFTLDFEFSAQ